MEIELIKQDFNKVYTIIDIHRARAFQEINNNSLMIAWNVGGYVSAKIKSSEWGSNVVTELSEYLRARDPSLKGYSRRTIYKMVQFYETYSTSDFITLLEKLKINGKLTLPKTTGKNSIVPSEVAQIVPFEMAQFPSLLLQINWTCHQQILNSCKTNEQRIFYILYSSHERFEVKELQRAIKTNAYESVLGSKDFKSSTLKNLYPETSLLLKDTAYLDFLGLPKKYKESRLRKGIVSHMKDFILELGKDFLFIDEEHQLEVGGKTYKADLLFYHRGLHCLVAIELKTDEFEPSYMGQLEFYLEALDQTEKRSNENPSIGILLCKEANREVVKYALNRSMSPTMVAEYKEKLIPQEVLQRSLEEFIGAISKK
ncbi:MAG: PDDEXK nuclease domain-containing protein [Spirochaetales bacterium]|nr:PDDEXK nuclease domain-containing protein [Spirochaetales bacterium]MDY5914383.1 PDDEXK nuclease domain-containing protein [Treponema sp.]